MSGLCQVLVSFDRRIVLAYTSMAVQRIFLLGAGRQHGTMNYSSPDSVQNKTNVSFFGFLDNTLGLKFRIYKKIQSSNLSWNKNGFRLMRSLDIVVGLKVIG